MGIECKELTPELWKDFESLFGERGACGGCWCMYWRQPRGEKWDDVKGAQAKERMKALILSGKAWGVLAYEKGAPMGWCSFGPRTDYHKLHRAPSFKSNDAEGVWSIPCFFVKKEFRGKGVAKTLLAAALDFMKGRGVLQVEGYPSAPAQGNTKTADAFLWTGPLRIFKELGFSRVIEKDKGKILMRKVLTHE